MISKEREFGDLILLRCNMTTKERTFGRLPVDLSLFKIDQNLDFFLMIYTCRMGYDHKETISSSS